MRDGSKSWNGQLRSEQITDRMDPWTRKVWQARQYGYSWKEISTWLGVSEQQAKMKFQYGLEKTRQSIVRLLKGAKAEEAQLRSTGCILSLRGDGSCKGRQV